MTVYFWFKAAHFIGFVAWFAGMFYIWRLFVYHVESEHEETKATLDIMADKLYRIIMVPASIWTLAFGLLMLWWNWNGLAAPAWIWIKLALVGLLFLHQALANHYRRKLKARATFESSKIFRLLNEVPTLILIAIVLLAVFKPF